MGFLEFHNSTPNPAQVYYRWSGGTKDVEINGETLKKLKGELVYFNGEEMEATELPFTFCVLNQTSSVTGFNPSGNIRYYSNEIVSFDEPMKVTRRTDDGTEVVAEGIYQNIKGKLPEGCKFQTNLYIYNPKTDRIERINLKGSALSAWIEFGQKNKGIYTHAVSMSVGEKKTVGSVDFLPPKFELGQEYTENDGEILKKQALILKDYLDAKRAANLGGNTTVTGDDGEAIDQTPNTYEGEQSQETPEAPQAEDGGITLEDVPF